MRGAPRIEKLTVVLPCFNEEANVGRIQTELVPTLNRLPIPWEIVAVDDGSTDSTYNRLTSLRSTLPGLKIVQHPMNLGLGAAVRSAFSVAEGDAVLTLDADLTFHPDQIPDLLKPMEADVAAVFGSPVRGGMSGVSLVRRFLSRGVNAIYRILLGENLTSVSSIFRVYRRDKLAELKLTSTSFDINAEIAVKLLQHGAVIKEVPATLTIRRFGESKIRTGREIANHLRMFLKIIGWRLRGRGSARKS